MTTASQLIDNLRERGVKLWVEAGQIQMSPASVITEEDIAAVKAVKGDILRILTPPPHGSINWPMAVHGRRLPACPWDGCKGQVTAHRELHLCLRCRTWFRLVPMEGVYKYD